jgi:hypothetical protein
LLPFVTKFNLVAKSATADLVLFNSVIVEAKFVFAVSKSFEVAEQFHSVKTKAISNNIFTSQIFFQIFFSNF